ncbi:hypothetical protein ACFQ0T_26275 [Kitasatospora gansuensis]
MPSATAFPDDGERPEYFEHPGLAEPRTKLEWRTYLHTLPRGNRPRSPPPSTCGSPPGRRLGTTRHDWRITAPS